MPTAPSPSPTSVDVSIEQEQLNNFLGPVNGALGGLPVAEKTQEFFIIYEGAGGTGPEIIDETAIFITYLVDSKGNVSKPSEDYASLYNLTQNFEVGKNAILRNEIASATNSQISGKHEITAIGRQLPLLYSQTGSTPGANVNQLIFNGELNSTTTPRMEGTMVRGIYDPTTNDFQTVTSYNSPVSPPEAPAATFDNTAGTYTISSADIGDTSVLIFEVSIGLRVQPNSDGDGPGVQPRDTIIRIKRGSTVIGTKTYTTQGTLGETTTFNFASDPLVVGQLSGFFNSGDPVYTVEIQFEDAIYTTADFIQFNIRGQNPPPSNPIAAPGYWFNNSGGNLWLTASAELSTNYGNTQNSQNVLDEIEPGFNFSPITVPFTLESGNRIRFEYNKSLDYTIYEVISPNEDVDGFLKLRLNTLVPNNVNLNNFVIHKTDPQDPVYIILNVKKSSIVGNSNAFKGVLLPEYPTQELKSNLDNIVLDLKERGLLPNEN